MRIKLNSALILIFLAATAFAQSPSPTPADKDKRGLGIQSSGSTSSSASDPRSREAKPELVLQTGYNTFYGATRMVFSPDGRLLATGTMRSNAVKLWETATNRKLRELSSGGTVTPAFTPSIAFSRDSKLVATSSGNTVTVWDVMSGRELHRLGGQSQVSFTSALGVSFIGFAAGNRLVTISDAGRIWDLSTGSELGSFETGIRGASAINGSDGGATISADGTQLFFVTEDVDPEIRTIDLASGKEAKRTKIPDDQSFSVQIAVNPDGQLLAAGVQKNRFKLWNLTSKKEHELGPTSNDFPPVKFSRDGRLVALSDNYTIKIWDLTTLRELPALKVPNTGAFAQANAFLSFSEDGKRIATGGYDTDTIVWETDTGKRLSNLNGRTNMAYNVAFSANGAELISGGRTRWDLRTGRGLRIAPDTSERTFGIASPDGKV
jgi:WD40 repeat protein